MLTVVLCSAVAGACGVGEAPATDATTRVVATTSIVADLVRVVAGDDIQVEQLMGPGVDPHLYKPSAGDVRRMAAASAVFYNGLHLEGKMTEVLAEMNDRDITTVAVAEAVPEAQLLRPADLTGVFDPHVWFDVALWQLACDAVRDALIGLDPEHADGFRARATEYRNELEELDGWARQRLREIPEPQRVLVTAHDAFAYFGRAYDLEVRGLLGVSTAAEAGASDVQALAELISTRRIRAVFVETSVPERYIAALREAVEARGFDVDLGGSLYSDALGDPDGPAGTYVGTVRANVSTIVAALGGDSR
jgi:manganese/zinc/iron transport system substrate-binding protein